MYKKIALAGGLFCAVAQCAPHVNPWLELKPSYFLFSSAPMKDIYDKGGLDIIMVFSSFTVSNTIVVLVETILGMLLNLVRIIFISAAESAVRILIRKQSSPAMWWTSCTSGISAIYFAVSVDPIPSDALMNMKARSFCCTAVGSIRVW